MYLIIRGVNLGFLDSNYIEVKDRLLVEELGHSR